ncbi:MAG: GNAT family N-acetyltransferase [Bryobacteraceae bacterium]|jgi:CelD/BcsL family acetyltransferase involved in cellulose biosynthesis
MNATSARLEWAEREVRLKFGFGGLLLFPVRFRAAVYEGPWESLPTDPDDPAPVFERHAPAVRALLSGSHPVTGKIARVAFRRDYIRYCRMQFRRFHVDIEGSFDDYQARLGRRRRHHLRNAVRRFAAARGGRIDWREYRREQEMAEFYRLAREVSRKTYQEGIFDSGLPAAPEFLESLKEAARDGRVRGYILFSEGRPIAYEHCPVRGDIITYERIGYDPTCRGDSPGTVLLLLTLQLLFETGEFRRFDFGVGDHDYKERVSTGYARCAEIYYFRRGMRNAALVLAHAALNTVWNIAGDLLERVGLRQRLRNLVRARYG